MENGWKKVRLRPLLQPFHSTTVYCMLKFFKGKCTVLGNHPKWHPKNYLATERFFSNFYTHCDKYKVGNTVQCITTTKVYLGGRKKKIEEELEKGGWMQK